MTNSELQRPSPPDPGATAGSASRLSRRGLIRAAAFGTGSLLAASGLSACDSNQAATSNPAKKRGGVLSHGATGGSLKDTLDPHFPVASPDIARCIALYEPLLCWDPDYKITPGLATSVEPSADATEWTVHLRRGVTFHHGKQMTAKDVVFSLHRVADPKNPAPGGVGLAQVLDLKKITTPDDYTVVLPLKTPYAVLDQLLAEYSVGIIPTDFDLKHPVGTGPFAYRSFIPGTISTFDRFADYWGEAAYVDQLVIYDFPDDAAKVNALLAGQVQTVDNLPTYLVDAVGKQGVSPLISETGAWVPFTMRMDQKPFSDNRVRKAMRLLVDRQQMIDQALSGYGVIGNDLYSPFDPAYDKSLPQRHQDIEQAKSLLKQAGHSDLQLELVTSDGIGLGAVESANLFASQAKAAGVAVRVNKTDSSIFYGDQYLSWRFAQDFWATRNYIPQVQQCAQKSSPYNETHFDDQHFNQLINRAAQETDETRRTRLLHAAQEIEYETGGLIIWGFKRQVDGYSNLVTGLAKNRYMPCSGYKFNTVAFVEES